jgi:hypothetical protein
MSNQCEHGQLARACEICELQKENNRLKIDKQKALDLLMLLSALESWSFATKESLPDYLHDRINTSVELLSAIILER